MARSSDSNVCKAFYVLFSSIVRALTLGYATLAVFAFFEIRELLRNSQNEDSFEIVQEARQRILYIPLIMCLPSELDFLDGAMTTMTTANLDTNATTAATSPPYYGTEQCRQLDYLITAIAASLLFASGASVLYVIIDCLSKSSLCCGCFGSSSNRGGGMASFGMGLFLSLILVQTGISTGALAEQIYYWVDYFQTLIDQQTDLDLKVKSYSSSWLLIATALGSFGIAVLILLETFVYGCCCMMGGTTGGSRRDDMDNESRITAQVGMTAQAQKIDEVAQNNSSITSDSDDLDASTISDRERMRPPWANSV